MASEGESTDADSESVSLVALRRRVRELATTDGDFVVRCARTGGRPVPVGDSRFPDRETAARATRLVVRYRERLRVWDGRTPVRDPVVHEEPAGDGCRDCASESFPTTLVERVRERGER